MPSFLLTHIFIILRQDFINVHPVVTSLWPCQYSERKRAVKQTSYESGAVNQIHELCISKKLSASPAVMINPTKKCLTKWFFTRPCDQLISWRIYDVQPRAKPEAISCIAGKQQDKSSEREMAINVSELSVSQHIRRQTRKHYM